MMMDDEDLERLRKELVTLNQEYSNLTRKLIRKNAQLQETLSQDNVPCMAPEEMVFDRAGLMQRVMGSQELFDKVVALVLDNGPARLAALTRAIEDRDGHAASMEAHGLKGMALNAGCNALAAVSEKAEAAARAGDMAQEARWVPELKKQIQRFRQTLKNQ